MAKIFETSDDVVEFIENKFGETGLDAYGLNLRIMSVTKANDIIKVSRASAATEFLTKKSDVIQVFVYESAFDRLTDEAKTHLVEMALSNVSVDTEKDRIIIESNPYKGVLGMRRKYGESVLDSIELGIMTIEGLEQEAKEKKASEREAKKAAKEQNQRY